MRGQLPRNPAGAGPVTNLEGHARRSAKCETVIGLECERLLETLERFRVTAQLLQRARTVIQRLRVVRLERECLIVARECLFMQLESLQHGTPVDERLDEL